MPYVLENAIRAAVGLRGVAVVAIPGDVALRKAVSRAISSSRALVPARPTVVPVVDELTSLAELLNGAERVTLFYLIFHFFTEHNAPRRRPSGMSVTRTF
jgi:pyruvate dehydrogenase (quinone)